jgi:hypothetical protein
MFCKECGKEIDNDSKFCSYCGTRQFPKQVSEDQSSLVSKQEHNTQNINVSLSFKKPSYKKNFEEIKKEEIKNTSYKVDKYDFTYKREINATITGIIILFVLSIILLISRLSEDPFFFALYYVFLTIWWIISIIWVVKIAKRQNRNTTGWGFFAFFLPFFGIIIIGLLKKLKKNSQVERIESILNPVKNSINLSNKYTPSTFIEKESNKIRDYWDGLQYEYLIEFSNGKTGKIYRLGTDVFLFDCQEPNIKIYYSNKKSAIIGLDYFLQTSEFYEPDRLKGNIPFNP